MTPHPARPRLRVRPSVICVALIAFAPVARAQRLQPVWVSPRGAFTSPRTSSRPLADSTGRRDSPLAAGLAGASGGVLIGSLITGGIYAAEGCTLDSCGTGAVYAGVTLGETVGMLVGVHAAGRSHPGDLLLSTGIAAAGLAAAAALNNHMVLIAVPVLQLALLLRR